MLEREPHAEVGRQAQCPDHLRHADVLGALGRLGCRAPTVTECEHNGSGILGHVSCGLNVF